MLIHPIFWFQGAHGKPHFVDSPRKIFLNVDHWLLHQGAVCTAERPRTDPTLPEENASLPSEREPWRNIECMKYVMG